MDADRSPKCRHLPWATQLVAATLCLAASAGRAAEGPASARLLPGADAVQLLGVQRVDGALRVQLSRWPTRAEGELALWLDHRDLSALAERSGPAQLRLTASALALAPAALRLRLWLVDADGWRAIGDRPIDRPTALPESSKAPTQTDPTAPSTGSTTPPTTGAAARALQPRIDLGFKLQPSAERDGQVPAQPRWHYRDLTLRASLQADDRVGPLTLRGAAQLAGSSFRGEALRYAALREDAPKVDLAEYRFDLDDGSGRSLALGHQAVGTHPLLLQGLASRGVQGRLVPAAGWEMSLAALSGSAFVGFDNPLGIADDEHRILLGQVARELRPDDPGALRVELSAMQAALRAQAAFNQGQVPDAEQLRGLGLRLTGRAIDGRARWDLAFAHSQYRPADDAQLAGDARLVPLNATSRNAYRVDLGLDLLRLPALGASGKPLTLTLQWRRLLVPPLYKTVGTFLLADQRADRAALVAQLGALQAEWSDERKRDNLDALPNLLTTGTRQQGLSIQLPAQAFAAPASAPSPWWPSTTVQWVRNRQQALDEPAFAQSGIAATHRPDQANRELRLGLSWALEAWQLGYTAVHGTQDNRQPGRESADFRNTGHQLRVQWTASDRLLLGLEAGRTRPFSVERNQAAPTRSATALVDWRWADPWSLQVQLADQASDDALQAGSQHQSVWQAQLTRRFTWSGGDGLPRPGQWFVRAVHARASQDAPLLGLNARGRSTLLNAGLNLSWEAP